jgi:peroxiredoxin
MRLGNWIARSALSWPLLSGCAAQQSVPTNPDGESGSEPSASQQLASETRAAHQQPPDFELDSLTGESIRLGDLVGKRVILLDFWATYCDPCLTAMPHLQALSERYESQGLTVLGISIDGPESIANVRSTVAKLGVKFPILLDDESRVVAQYNPRTSAPFSVLIALNGEILIQQEGFTTGNEKSLDDAVVRALSAGSIR